MGLSRPVGFIHSHHRTTKAQITLSLYWSLCTAQRPKLDWRASPSVSSSFHRVRIVTLLVLVSVPLCNEKVLSSLAVNNFSTVVRDRKLHARACWCSSTITAERRRFFTSRSTFAFLTPPPPCPFICFDPIVPFFFSPFIVRKSLKFGENKQTFHRAMFSFQLFATDIFVC